MLYLPYLLALLALGYALGRLLLDRDRGVLLPRLAVARVRPECDRVARRRAGTYNAHRMHG